MHSLGISNQHPFLGVILDSKLRDALTLDKQQLKLRFQKFNVLLAVLLMCEVHCIVQLTMEYAAVVWDPYHHNNIQQLEKVQCRAVLAQ